MGDVLDMAMDILDIMASVMPRPSPRLMLIPTFCMEDMAMDTILDMPDIEDMLDTHMVDMPTTDKLTGPRHQNGQTTILVFSTSDHNISVLDTFLVTDSRKQ